MQPWVGSRSGLPVLCAHTDHGDWVRDDHRREQGQGAAAGLARDTIGGSVKDHRPHPMSRGQAQPESSDLKASELMPSP